MDGMKHKSASCKLRLSVVDGYLEVTHFQAKKPGLGHGSELLRRLAKWADKKKQPLILTCDNSGLWRFYCDAGFEMLQYKPVTILARLPR